MMTSRCQSLSHPTFISRKKHFPFLLQRQDSLRSRDNQALSQVPLSNIAHILPSTSNSSKNHAFFSLTLLTHRGEEQHRSFSIFPDAEEETDELFSSFIVLQERHHFRFIDHFPRVFPRALPASHSSYNPTSQGTLGCASDEMAQKSGDGATSMFTERGKAERLRRLRRVVEPIAPLRQRGSFEEEEHPSLRFPREK